jgi:hypothetical protein
MNWEGFGRKRSLPNYVRYYLDIFLEQPRKTTRNLGQDIGRPDRYVFTKVPNIKQELQPLCLGDRRMMT